MSLFSLANVIMPLLQQQAEQVECLGQAAVRCGFNALDIQHANGLPTKDAPSRLMDGTGQELGRWWYDLEHACCYVQGTQPDVRDMYDALRAANAQE